MTTAVVLLLLWGTFNVACAAMNVRNSRRNARASEANVRAAERLAVMNVRVRIKPDVERFQLRMADVKANTDALLRALRRRGRGSVA